jgi:hypothetical protein
MSDIYSAVMEVQDMSSNKLIGFVSLAVDDDNNHDNIGSFTNLCINCRRSRGLKRELQKCRF